MCLTEMKHPGLSSSEDFLFETSIVVENIKYWYEHDFFLEPLIPAHQNNFISSTFPPKLFQFPQNLSNIGVMNL